MRVCTHSVLITLVALLAAQTAAAKPVALEELSPDAAPPMTGIVSAFPDCWKAQGLPAVRASGPRVSVFGSRHNSWRWVTVHEGWARVSGYAPEWNGNPELSYELTLGFERRKDRTFSLSGRYERKLAEFQRLAKLSPPFAGPGYCKVSTDFVNELPAKGAEQVSLLRFGDGDEVSLQSLELVLLWQNGCFDYLLELSVASPEIGDYGRIALALQESLQAVRQ
jgi:hypothetical protein